MRSAPALPGVLFLLADISSAVLARVFPPAVVVRLLRIPCEIVHELPNFDGLAPPQGHFVHVLAQDGGTKRAHQHFLANEPLVRLLPARWCLAAKWADRRFSPEEIFVRDMLLNEGIDASLGSAFVVYLISHH